ncbi:MAG: tyrosine-type recombinase/integrase [Gallionellaceae bacterium]
MPLYKDPKSPFWYAAVYVNGKRIRRCTGTDDWTQAKRFHDELKAEQWDNSVQSGTVSWRDACAAWMNDKPRSDSDLYSIRKLNDPEHGFQNCALTDLTPTSFLAYLPKVDSTFNRYATIINAILNLAKARGEIDKPPLIKKKKITPGRIHWFTKEQWESLYIQLPEHLKPMAKFSIATGLRQSNVTKLKWSQIDLKRRVMWVHADEMKGRKPVGLAIASLDRRREIWLMCLSL